MLNKWDKVFIREQESMIFRDAERSNHDIDCFPNRYPSFSESAKVFSALNRQIWIEQVENG